MDLGRSQTGDPRDRAARDKVALPFLVGAVGIATGVVALAGSLKATVIAIVALTGLTTLATYPRRLIFTLVVVVLASLEQLSFHIGTLGDAKPYQFIGIAVVAYTIAMKRWSLPVVRMFTRFLPYILVSVVATAFSARVYSSAQMVLLLVVEVVFGLAIAHVVRAVGTEGFVKVLTDVATLFGAFGLAQFLLGRFGVTILPAMHVQLFKYGQVYSVFTEPDWFGTFEMLGASLFVLPILRGEMTGRRWAKFTVVGLGMLLSLARASWVGFLAIALIAIISEHRRGNKHLGRVVAVAVGVLVLAVGVLFVISPYAAQVVVVRLANTANPNGVGAQYRLGVWRTLLALANLRPWLGFGPGEAGAVINFNDIIMTGPLTNRVATNIVLDVYYNTGLLGILSLLWPMWSAVRGALLRTSSEDYSLGLAFIGLLVSCVFSNAMFMGFFWLVLGGVVAAGAGE